MYKIKTTHQFEKDLKRCIKTEEELSELRQVVCDYYARKIDEEMDRLWAEGKWDNEKNEAVLKEHLRTPYRYAK